MAIYHHWLDKIGGLTNEDRAWFMQHADDLNLSISEVMAVALKAYRVEIEAQEGVAEPVEA